jgi:Family of unknown function (DUF5900)
MSSTPASTSGSLVAEPVKSVAFDATLYERETFYFKAKLGFVEGGSLWFSLYHLMKASSKVRKMVVEKEKLGKKGAVEINFGLQRQRVLRLIHLLEESSDLRKREYTELEVRELYCLAIWYGFDDMLVGMNRWITENPGRAALEVVLEYCDGNDYQKLVDEYIESGCFDLCRAVLETTVSEEIFIKLTTKLPHREIVRALAVLPDCATTKKIVDHLNLDALDEEFIQKFIDLKLLDPARLIKRLTRQCATVGMPAEQLPLRRRVFSNGFLNYYHNDYLWLYTNNAFVKTECRGGKRHGISITVYNNEDILTQLWNDNRREKIISFEFSDCPTVPAKFAGKTLGEGIEWVIETIPHNDAWSCSVFWPAKGSPDEELFWEYVEKRLIGWDHESLEYALKRRAEMLASEVNV